MRKIYIGADPGASGAFALVIDGKLIRVEDMPVVKEIKKGKTKTTISESGVADIIASFIKLAELNEDETITAIIELVGAMSKQGVVSTFNFGMAFGILKGAFASFGITRVYVRPAVWKKHFKLSANKDEARALASQTFPEHTPLFKRKKDDGRAESSLLAYYGHLKQV